MPDDPPPTLDLDRMLLDFVSGRDVDCPQCGYNLRDLTTTTCPECKQTLEMRVGVQHPHLLPFVLAIAPGIFGGMCAAAMAVMMGLNYVSNAGHFVGIPWPFFVLNLSGWLSGLTTVGLIATRNRFLAKSKSTQRRTAVFIWIANIMAVLLFVALVMLFM